MKQTTGMKIQFGSINPTRQQIMPPVPKGGRTCPTCGAPVLSEVCQYCGTYIGAVATSELTPEYELIHCKNARLSFWSIGFPAFFGIPFLCGGIGSMAAALALPSDDLGFRVTPVLMSFPFMLIGAVALFILFSNLKRFLDTKRLGVVREGIVYGYMDDVVSYNNNNGQQVKILLDTAEGKKFILLPLGTTAKLYEVNSPIRVKLYKRFAMITNDAVDNIKW